jgi:hypothetical protein
VVVGRVVITDIGVEPPGGRGKIAIHLVRELIPLNVYGERVRYVRAEYNFRKEIQVIGELGGDEEIELAGLE